MGIEMTKRQEHLVMKLSLLESSRLVTLTFARSRNAATEFIRDWKLVRRELTRRQR